MKTDFQLVQDAKDGKKSAFEELMLRHDKFLLKVIVRMTRDLDAAEDIVQEAFIKAYKRLTLFEGRSSFRSWLYQIAVNTARNRFRRSVRERSSSEPIDMAVEAQAENQMMTLDVRQILNKEIENLPERQKTALSLRIFEDLSFKEIAEMMDCPYDTAKANYRHALLKLRERLSGNVVLRGWAPSSTAQFSLLELGQLAVEIDG